jgi:uncharacterized membrane protein YedE/YeeE
MAGLTAFFYLAPELVDDLGFRVFLIFGWCFVGMMNGFVVFQAGCFMAGALLAIVTAKPYYDKWKVKANAAD